MTAITAPVERLEDTTPTPGQTRHLAIICSKGSLDMAYPALIMANAARMTGVDTTIFFTFWGLDIINNAKVDNLHISTVGNPSMAIPTMAGGLPGMEAFATSRMKKELEGLDIPDVREFIEVLHDSGAKLYACELAMEMFKLKETDLVEGVDGVLTAMDFMELTEGAQVLFI